MDSSVRILSVLNVQLGRSITFILWACVLSLVV